MITLNSDRFAIEQLSICGESPIANQSFRKIWYESQYKQITTQINRQFEMQSLLSFAQNGIIDMVQDPLNTQATWECKPGRTSFSSAPYYYYRKQVNTFSFNNDTPTQPKAITFLPSIVVAINLQTLALLQIFYMFDDMFDTQEELLSGQKEGNVLSNWQRQPRNCAFNLNMPDLPRKKGYPMGLKNQGMTCYLNSLLQILYNTPQLRKMILSLPLCKETAESPSQFVNKSRHNFLLGFQRLFSQMALNDVRAVGTEYLNKSFGWQGAQHMQQQDIQEAMRIIFDTIERALYGTQYQQAVQSLFRGSTQRYKSCLACCVEVEHQQNFYDLQLQVKNIQSLDSSLVVFSTPEMMEGDNKIFCQTCQSKQDMFLGTRLHDLPSILVFTLNRFDFDYQKFDRVKITTKFEYQLQIDLNSYLPNPPQNPVHHQYQLYGVLIHRGSAHGGHYISYVRDLLQESDWSQGLQDAKQQQKRINSQKQKKENAQKKQTFVLKQPSNKDLLNGWYQINDSIVTAITSQSLAKQFEGSESAYILFYRRKGLDSNKQGISVPSYFQRPINSFNETLKVEREVYQNQKNHIIVSIKGQTHKLKTKLAITEFVDLFVPKGYALVQEATHNGLPYFPMQFINHPDTTYKAESTLESELVVHQSSWQLYEIGSAEYQLIRNTIGQQRLPFELVLLEGQTPRRIVCYNDENFLMLRIRIEKQLKISYEKQVLTLVTPYKQTILTDVLENDDLLLPKLGIAHCGQIIVKTLGADDGLQEEEHKGEAVTYCFLIERDDVIGLKRIYFEKNRKLNDLLNFVIASESLKEGKYRFRSLGSNRLYYLDHYEKFLQELQFTEEMIKLRVERGEVPIKGDICVKIKLQSQLLKEQRAGLQKIFDPNTLLSDVKEWACSSCGLETEMHKLYLTDWTGEPIRSLTRQKITIFQASFGREQLICLRDINSPIGSELVHLQVFFTTTGSSDSVDKQSFHVKIEQFKTVADLKQILIATVQKLKDINPQCLRLREIKRDYMFGAIWRESNKSLKSLTVNSNKIVYQILQQPEELKEDQIVVILKKRNKEKKIYEGSEQLIFEAGRTPTVQALNQAIKKRIQISQPIKIMKYVNYDFQWVEISKENIEKLLKKKNTKTQKKEKGQPPQKGKKEQQKKQPQKKEDEDASANKAEVKKEPKEPHNKKNKGDKGEKKRPQQSAENKKTKQEGQKKQEGQHQKKEKQQKKGDSANKAEDFLNLRKAPILLKDGDWIGWGIFSELQGDDLQTSQDLSLRVIKQKGVFKGNEKGGFKINVDF